MKHISLCNLASFEIYVRTEEDPFFNSQIYVMSVNSCLHLVFNLDFQLVLCLIDLFN